MADVTIRGVTYQGVAKLDLDKSGGGSALYYDTENANAVAADIAVGKTAYGAAGLITGTKQPPSGTIGITENGTVDVTDYATAVVNVSGGGGTNIQFSVVAYPTATDIDTITGEENELGVLTDVTPTGYVASHQEPTGTAGLLWVKLGTSSKNQANILLTGAIWLNIQSVYQYVSGAWVKCKAYLYQSSAWHDLDIFLFDNGDRCSLITGGWTASSSVQVNDSAIHFNSNSSGSTSLLWASTASPVDFGGYTKIKAKANVVRNASANANKFTLRIGTGQGSAGQLAQVYSNTTGDQTLELDISAYKNRTDCYVGFRQQNYTGADVYEVWLE